MKEYCLQLMCISFGMIFSEIYEPLDFNENMSSNIVLYVVFLKDVRFCRNCYLAFTLFIPNVIPKKFRFQYFLYIARYKEQNVIDCVSVIPIDDFTNILS